MIHVTTNFGCLERIISSSTLWILLLKTGRRFFAGSETMQPVCQEHLLNMGHLEDNSPGQQPLD